MQTNSDILVNEENIKNIPLAHFSVSGMLEYMKNEYSFFDKYVLLNWNNTTGQPLIVGSAFHYALEQYYNLCQNDVIKNGFIQVERKIEGKTKKVKIIVEEFILNIAKEKLDNDLESYYRKGIQDLAERKFDKTRLSEFNDLKAIMDKETRKLDKGATEKQSLNFFLNSGISELEYYPSKDRFIEWGKKQSPGAAHIELKILVTNYFSRKPYGPKEVLYVEANEKSQITDLEGNIMPMPLKGKMDLIIRDKEGKIGIIDHKTATTFSKENKKAQYEIQAGAYFFLAWAITGEQPSYMIFDEISKKKGVIGKGLLKADLIIIGEESETFGKKYPNFQKNYKVDELRGLLFIEGLVEEEPVFNPVKIDFEANPHIVTAFLQIYKTILNRLAIMSLYDVPLDFLPNPFADYSGEYSWKTYKDGLDKSKTWKDTLKKVTEENKQEVDDFDL